VRQLAAVFLALLTSLLYAAASALQALEARQIPPSAALRASLLTTLARRRLWIAGGVASLLGWACEAGALALASVELVQPALGLGLIALLALGVRVLHERVGPIEVAGAVAIAAAIAVLAWAAPSGSTSFTTGGTWAVGVALVLTAAAPLVLRAAGPPNGLWTSVAAGLGWACVGLATALLVDAIRNHRWVVFVVWAVAVGVASAAALLAEMTALQFWPATRAVPLVFSLEMGVPAAVAPVVAHANPLHPAVFAVALAVACGGAIVVGRSRSVAGRLTA
jgi:drug/metabolite transporter (DMT)-like permease